jgi:hypothetical protein
MRALFYIFPLLLLAACNAQKGERTINANEIEITFDNSWTGGKTVYISKNAIIKVGEYYRISSADSVICFSDTLERKEIDSINKYLDIIRHSETDSLYEGNCEDCGSFFVRISFEDGTITSLIIGTYRHNNSLSRMARFIIDLKAASKIKCDSGYMFRRQNLYHQLSSGMRN